MRRNTSTISHKYARYAPQRAHYLTGKTANVMADEAAATKADLSISSDAIGKVRVGPSSIVGAGRGLTVTQDVGANEELLRDGPLAMITWAEARPNVCDWCHADADPYHYTDARDQPLPGHSPPIIRACTGCRARKYCSQVSQSFFRHFIPD